MLKYAIIRAVKKGRICMKRFLDNYTWEIIIIITIMSLISAIILNNRMGIQTITMYETLYHPEFEMPFGLGLFISFEFLGLVLFAEVYDLVERYEIKRCIIKESEF